MNMSMRLAVISSGLVLTAAAVFACSDDTTPTPSGDSDAAAGSSGSDGSSGSSGSSGTSGTSGQPDTAPATLNGCKIYVDRTAEGASRVIQWDTSLFQREERCMKIKRGQKVTFATDDTGSTPADFDVHPLGAQGGDTPNPVESALEKNTGEVSFATAGDFGYICTVHPAMIGAIVVTE